MGFMRSLLGSIKFWYAAIRDLILLVLYIFYTYLGILWRWVFPRKPKSLKNEIILITGSANGIGRQICLKLVDSGAKMVCWDISKRENNALIVELKSLGGEAFGYEVDVSDLGQVQRTAALVKDQVGDVTMIINNAGIMPVHNFLSHNPREITRCFSVNVYGPMWILREFLPYMIDIRRGHVVTICSFGGILGSRNLTAYCGTKHAINGVMESMRDEVRVHPSKPDIKFTTVYPSCCNTSFAQNVIHSRFPWLLPEMVEPDYVAEKTVEGILYNRDYVFIPPIFNFMSRILRAFPANVYWAMLDFVNYYVEPKENTRVMAGPKLNGSG
ncbi:17-beta-hydroxysteroid dehydrogenase 13 [Folsomia candida]|uniref:Short-chain dehydrogenase/reductase 3 n=1 Tax=Folsomia candida TaxID=158441 RepID=A0A226D678_FOLCA|nr:17-beta-hydroxysteroid dehydrogenase 13 [Folsomia candida]OXA40600.1 Epidermal retinol dehydrogenase 2 [Folsomia candida]